MNANFEFSGQPALVVIGAGFAGLAAAVELASAGHCVTLIEATKHGGGRARSFHDTALGCTVDNGQHLMMGCYRETLRFLQTIGSVGLLDRQPRMHAKMLRPHGKAPIEVSCPRLPAPFHLAAGIASMRGIGLLHRLATLRAGLLLPHEVARPNDNETCDAWLRRMGQTQAMRRAFWDPFIWGTLNDDPLIASAAMLLAVLDRAFLGQRADSSFVLARVGLSELYVEPALAYLRARKATILLGDPVRALELGEGGNHQVVLKSERTIPARAIVAAVPPHALLPLLPDSLARHLIFRDVARLEHSPIVNLWARFDRPLWKKETFVGLIDSPLHWIFDRNRVEHRDDQGPTVASFTISGARMAVEDRVESLQRLVSDEVKRFFGISPKILAFRAIKEKRATISHAAGTYQRRPETRTPVRGLVLAGDWIKTGLPATIESAVQSGHVAAQTLLHDQVLKVSLGR